MEKKNYFVYHYTCGGTVLDGYVLSGNRCPTVEEACLELGIVLNGRDRVEVCLAGDVRIVDVNAELLED